MINCPICNKPFKQLTNTHLNKTHNLTMVEFDKFYPNFIKQTPDIYKHKDKLQKNISSYNDNPSVCSNCNHNLPYEKRNNKFCSKSCSATFNNKGRVQSDETKLKISKANTNLNPILHTLICSYCNHKFTHKNKLKKTCSSECNHMIQKETLSSYSVEAGKKSASIQVKRSKNEIHLFELLNTKYDCLHNKPFFNGWDADIIIPSLKLAILWNGPWHYTNVMKGHSVKQTLNRDMIKLSEIQKEGYSFIIVKDYNNKITPESAFQIILNYIDNSIYNLTII